MRVRAWVAGVVGGLVLAGCGGSVSCELDGLSVRLETGALCGQAEVTVTRARVMLAGVVPAERFAEVFAGLEVRVLDADVIEGNPGGFYFPAQWEGGERIELTRTGRSLLHELLHAREVRAGVAKLEDPHAGWDAKGYRELDASFKNTVPDLSR